MIKEGDLTKKGLNQRKVAGKNQVGSVKWSTIYRQREIWPLQGDGTTNCHTVPLNLVVPWYRARQKRSSFCL